MLRFNASVLITFNSYQTLVYKSFLLYPLAILTYRCLTNSKSFYESDCTYFLSPKGKNLRFLAAQNASVFEMVPPDVKCPQLL